MSSRAAKVERPGGAERAVRRRAMLVALSCALAGCAHYPPNAPLERVDSASGYRIRATAGDADDSTELAIALTFSGGGTRAAAFAYGVLAALRDIEVEFDGDHAGSSMRSTAFRASPPAA